MDDCLEQDQPRRQFDDRGANLVEYALLVALIVVVCIAATSYFASAANDKLISSCDAIAKAGEGTAEVDGGTTASECQ